MQKLTNKQKAFVEYYLECWNATEAARKAGYSGGYDGLRVIGSRNLTKPHIKIHIDRRMKELTIPADEVIMRLGQHATASVSDFIDETGVIDFRKVKEKGYLIKKIVHRKGQQAQIELHDPQSALVHLGRHYQLFTDKIKIEDWRSEIIDLIRDGRATPEQVINDFGRDLAKELFESANIPISES